MTVAAAQRATGPYEARFEGGPLDGQVLKVASMLPDRYVWPEGKVAAKTKPAPPIPYDLYSARQYDPELIYVWKGQKP